MAIIKNGSLDPHGAPVLRREILTNSIVSTQHDSLKLASGFIALGTAGAAVFGHLVAHKDSDGVGLNTTGAAGAQIGSYVNTFTAASDNQTVDQVVAECDISKMSLYSAEVDATIGSTTGSNLAGYRMDLADEDTLDEDTAATTAAQYGTWGTNPEDTSKAIVNIYESQVFGV